MGRMVRDIWFGKIPNDGRLMITYTYYCSEHRYNPHKECAMCDAVNEILRVQRIALEFNQKHIELKDKHG